ncbi:hypothetical protein DyAD56_08300 [Dyella sp. AD56]|uniref:diguanylate cyclase domain-containing protein n=1 Tax=Dyella sp. AD56 TaxID=1528744 RepID=UPI000CB9BA21|nr:diguanylate cyclase [Dyella sp. AD56]PMQ05783.1 hypothetical protein DyAD56_08300 [Dyella sp. AD56]
MTALLPVAPSGRLAITEPDSFPDLLSIPEVNLTPFWSDHTLHAATSIGVATYPLHGRSSRELMRAADTAMYWVKKNGGNRVHVAATQDIQI